MTYMYAKRIDGKLYLEVSDELVSALESAGVRVVSTNVADAEEERLFKMGMEEMDRFDEAFRILSR